MGNRRHEPEGIEVLVERGLARVDAIREVPMLPKRQRGTGHQDKPPAGAASITGKTIETVPQLNPEQPRPASERNNARFLLTNS